MFEMDEAERRKEQEVEKVNKSWVKAFEENGYPYYYNIETEEYRWEKPEGFIEEASDLWYVHAL